MDSAFETFKAAYEAAKADAPKFSDFLAACFTQHEQTAAQVNQRSDELLGEHYRSTYHIHRTAGVGVMNQLAQDGVEVETDEYDGRRHACVGKFVVYEDYDLGLNEVSLPCNFSVQQISNFSMDTTAHIVLAHLGLLKLDSFTHE